MKRFLISIIIISANTFVFQAPTARADSPHLVMKLVAEVNQKVLSSRDVEVHYLVTKILEGQVSKLPLAMDSDDFRLSLDQLIVESMVYSEAVDFGIAKITDEEMETAFKNVKQKIGETAALKARWIVLDYSDAKLRDKIQRRLRSGKLLKYKADSNNQQVTDDEAKDYFEKNKQRFGNIDFENYKPTIKKFIAKKTADDRLREWFDVLKKKYKVKTLI